MICTAIESLWYYVSWEQIKSFQLSQLVSHATQSVLCGYMHQKEAPNVLKEVE